MKKKKVEKEALERSCREERRTLEATIARMRDGISQAAGLFARKQAELEAHEGAAPVLPVISYLSLSETQKIVLNIRNFPICTGTTGANI